MGTRSNRNGACQSLFGSCPNEKELAMMRQGRRSGWQLYAVGDPAKICEMLRCWRLKQNIAVQQRARRVDVEAGLAQ